MVVCVTDDDTYETVTGLLISSAIFLSTRVDASDIRCSERCPVDLDADETFEVRK